ncbi:mCG147557 [Mus musculus]|nr:mCG147557 [Mus musculus]
MLFVCLDPTVPEDACHIKMPVKEGINGTIWKEVQSTCPGKRTWKRALVSISSSSEYWDQL